MYNSYKNAIEKSMCKLYLNPYERQALRFQSNECSKLSNSNHDDKKAVFLNEMNKIKNEMSKTKSQILFVGISFC